MPKSSSMHESILQFLLKCGRLKSEARRGWIRKVGITKPESVADHSYRTALMAMLFAELKGLDVCRALKMAILHDLPEAIIGDATPEETSPRERRKQKHWAMMNLISKLPVSVRIEYGSLWNELMKNQSDEARLVSQVDKLEMAIQASEYVQQGYNESLLKEFFETAHRAVKVDLLRKLLSLLES